MSPLGTQYKRKKYELKFLNASFKAFLSFTLCFHAYMMFEVNNEHEKIKKFATNVNLELFKASNFFSEEECMMRVGNKKNSLHLW